MTNCSNCYNGCTEIVSDRCVKYTGIDVPVLGIKTGDSLSYVEQALITFLTSTLDGTGVKIDLGDTVICNLVQQYLPTCKDLSIVDISKALIEAACDLQEQIDAVVADVAVIEADYTVNCLSGVTASSGTHAIVQAVITKLCQVQVDLTALALNVSTNYINIDNIDSYIQEYIDNEGSSTLVSNKMVPYTVLPYFGTLANFNGTGAGTGDWLKIYLCNGENGTPDLRGRVLVGATSGMFGLGLDPAVDPAISGNPSYALSGSLPPLNSSFTGVNQVTLNATQIPSHTHVISTTVNVTEEPHRHKFSDDTNGPTNALRANNDILPVNTTPSNAPISGSNTGAGRIYETSAQLAGVAVEVEASAEVAGGGLSHLNYQPGAACYYIIYIP
jgi:microcystin-dependent protein